MSTKNITFPSDTVCITCFGRSGEGRRRKGLLRSVSKALGCAVVALEYAFKADARRVFGGECRGQQFGVHLNSRSKGQRRQPVRAAGGTHHFGADWRQNTKGFGADWRHNTKTSVELICFLPLDILPAYEHTTRLNTENIAVGERQREARQHSRQHLRRSQGPPVRRRRGPLQNSLPLAITSACFRDTNRRNSYTT